VGGVWLLSRSRDPADALGVCCALRPHLVLLRP
jgi:hypothetical protein